MSDDHPTMTEEEYDLRPGIRSSWLKVLHEQTPAHMRQAMLSKRRDTDAFRFGRALHCLVLRPQDWDAQFYKAVRHDRRTKEGKLAAEQQERFAAGRTLIDFDDWVRATEMAAEIREAAGFLLDLAPLREHPLFATLEGVPCKARVDAAGPTGVLLDIKTTISAAPRSFARSASVFGYLLQLSFYRLIMRENGFPDGPTIIVAVEKDAPYAAAHYVLLPDQMRRMEDRIRELLRIWERCRLANDYPAFSNDIIPLELPEWAFSGQTGLEDINDGI